jgi:DNA-binding IclR family transcriptional regulator
VRDRTGAVIASISVWGAEKSILRARSDELAHRLGLAAREVSRDLGFVEAAPAKARVSEATEA